MKTRLILLTFCITTLICATACNTNPPSKIANLRAADLETTSAVIQFEHYRYAKGPFKPKRSFAGTVDSSGQIELYKMGRIATSRPLWDDHGLSLIDEKWLYRWNPQFERFPADNGDTMTDRVRVAGTDEALWLTNEGFVGDNRYLVRAITSDSNTTHYQLLTALASCESEVYALAADYPRSATNANNESTELTVTRIWKDGKPRDEIVISGVKFSDYDDMILDDGSLWCHNGIIKGVQPKRSQGNNKPFIDTARLYSIDIVNQSIDFLDLSTTDRKPVKTHAEYTSAIYGRVDGENAYWATSDGQVWSTNLSNGISRLIVNSEPDSPVTPKHARDVTFQRDHVAVLTRYYRDDNDSGAIIRWYSLADGRQLNEIDIKSLGNIERKYNISMSGFATNPHAVDSR